MQVFESVEEVDQIEAEVETKGPGAKQPPRGPVPNGVLQNGVSSPDSGHPSSRNFSVTSGLSDVSFSTEDSACVPDLGPRTPAPAAAAAAATPPPERGTPGDPLVVHSPVTSGDPTEEEKPPERRRSRGDQEAAGPDQETVRAEVDGEQPEAAGAEQAGAEQAGAEQAGGPDRHTDTIAGEDPEHPAPRDASHTESASTHMPQEETETNVEGERGAEPEQTRDLESKEAEASRAPPEVLPTEGDKVVAGDETGDAEAPAALKSLLLTGGPCTVETYRPAPGLRAQSDSESESPSAIEMEDIPKASVSMGPWDRKGRCEGWSSSEELRGEASPEGARSGLSEEPQMESLYPPPNAPAQTQGAEEEGTSPVAAKPAYSVRMHLGYTPT